MGIELKFIEKEKIGRLEDIKIPSGANMMRLKKGQVFFFRAITGRSKDYIRIPINATEVTFPDYKRNDYTTYYGIPKFHK